VLLLSNQGRLQTSGFDLGANASHGFDWGQFNLAFNGTWTREFLFQATPASINRECVRYYSVSCGNPQPKFSSNARLTFTSNTGSTISLNWRHLSSARVEPVAPVPQLPVGTPTTAGPAGIVQAYQRISPYDWFDLALQQQVGENLRLTLTVQNLFDRDPPDVGASVAGAGPNSGNTFPAVYDPLGRRFTMGVNLRF
jgi:outer membrane receptor protein involved in Fe transport